MTQTYRDPTFDEVAAREAASQRRAEHADLLAKRLAARRDDPAYRAMRRRKIKRLTRRAMLGLGR